MKTFLYLLFGSTLLAVSVTSNAQTSTNPPVFTPHSPWSFTPMVRHDWTDVSSTEDPSNPSSTAGNIQGATFSYSDNEQSKTRTWTAAGALIGALRYSPDLQASQGAHLNLAGIVPSISIYKVSSSGRSGSDVDHLYYRLGGFGSWIYYPGDGYLNSSYLLGFEARGGFVYDTDTDMRASLPGGELDLEPKFLWRNGTNPTVPWLSIGYQNRVGETAMPLVLFQLRAWAHFEGGDIQQNGANWDVVNGSFFRVGPQTRAQMSFPHLNNIGITGEYDYSFTLTGNPGRNELYKIGGSFPIYSNKSTGAKIALNADYTKGGLTLSKQEVNIFTIGLGVTY